MEHSPTESGILIPVGFGLDAESKQHVIKEVQGLAEKLGKTFHKSAQRGEGGFKALGYQITFVAWHIRFLGNVLDQVGRQFTRVISDWIKTGSELQDRFFGLQTSAALYGFSAEKALQVSRDLATKGLVPLTTSAQAMSNIMLTGAFNVDQASDFMTRYLDVATLVTGGQAEMAKSLEFFTESVLRGTMVLGTDVTARALWNITNQRVRKELGLVLQKLSAQRRILEIQKTLYTGFNEILGLHEVRMSLVGANLTRMTESYQYLKYELTMALWPAIKLISEGIVKFISIIGALVKNFSSLFSVFVVTNVITTILLGSFLTLLGTVLSVIKIISWATVTTETYSWALVKNYAAGLLTTKSYLLQATALKILGFSLRWAIPLVFLFEILLMGFVYGLLKLTGATNVQSEATDKMKRTFQGLANTLQRESGLFDAAADSQEDANEKKALSHRRSVEDLEEDLERERSKGLWADQLKIKDLEKRLARENEDYAASLADRKKQTAGLTSPYLKVLDDLSVAVEKHQSVWANLWDWIKKIDWKKFGRSIANAISDGFWAAWNLLERFNNWLKKQDWVEIGKKIGRWIRDGIYSIYETSIKIGEKIKKFLEETDFIEIGKTIGKWIRKGILSAFEIDIKIKETINKFVKETDFTKIGEDIGYWICKAILESFKFIAIDIPLAIVKGLKGKNLDFTKIGDGIGELIVKGTVETIILVFNSKAVITQLAIGIAKGLSRAFMEVMPKAGDALRELVGELLSSLPNYRKPLLPSAEVVPEPSSALRELFSESLPSKPPIFPISPTFSIPSKPPIFPISPTFSIPSKPPISLPTPSTFLKLPTLPISLPKLPPPPLPPKLPTPSISPIISTISKIGSALQGVVSKVVSSLPKLKFWQTGHVQVPGRRGQPIPSILHGGETIIPAHESAAASSIVINIYNPVIRNDNDLTRLADLIEERLGLKNRWARRGAY